jgi:ABC-type glycerol-3-phosphate transport system substrate-binding protein
MSLRRTIIVAAVGILMAGCSGNKGNGKTEVTYNCAASATDIRSLEAEIPAFAESSGVAITLQPFTGQEKLYAMMAADQAPDIFYTNTVVRDRLAAEGRLLNLRTVGRDDPFLSRLWPDVLAGGTGADGGLYSIGNWTFTAGVYYNKDLFDALGIAYPDSAWTWDDMRVIARKVVDAQKRAGKPDRYGIFIGSHFVELLELMNGTRVHPRASFLRIGPESVEAFRAYRALMDDGLMPDQRRIQSMGMQAVQLLQGGVVAMLVESVPHQTLIETLDMRWGIAPLPRFGTKPPRYFRSESGGLSISAQSGHPEGAWKALRWIVAGASVYQPNPVMRDVDFTGGWEARYPKLTGSGFREVWERSIASNGGDPRFFVRFSTWSSAPILERLQPLLDRVWAKDLPVEALVEAVPAINDAVRADLEKTAGRKGIAAPFLEEIRGALSEKMK